MTRVAKSEKIARGAAKNLFRFQITFISIILLIAIIGTLVSQSILAKGKIIVLSILIPLIILGYFWEILRELEKA